MSPFEQWRQSFSSSQSFVIQGKLGAGLDGQIAPPGYDRTCTYHGGKAKKASRGAPM